MAMRHLWLAAALALVSTMGPGCSGCQPPQNRLCQPCGAAGCKVPGWPNALCNGGVCRPACPGNEKFQCQVDKAGAMSPRCVESSARHCANPDKCP